MIGLTHSIVGIATTYSVGYLLEANHLLSVSPVGIVSITVGAIIFSQLPDIDTKNSRISNSLGFITKIPSYVLKHRGFTHSLFALLVLAGILLLITHSYVISILLLSAYFSHLAIDMFNKTGLQLFFPVKNRFALYLVKSDNVVANFLLNVTGISIIFCIAYLQLKGINVLTLGIK
jgi:inner membrane protein